MDESGNTIINGKPGQFVKLNVGGSLFQTTIGTLTKADSMLRAMFSGQLGVHTDSDGCILIDRDGKHFRTILNFLRDASAPLPENDREVQELLAEARYYLIQDLIDLCEAKLTKTVSNNDTLISTRKKYIKGSPDQYIKLNVGGTRFITTIGTLTKTDGLLARMVTGQVEVQIDSEGYVLIDGNGKHFHYILSILRTGGRMSVIFSDYPLVANELKNLRLPYSIDCVR